MAAAPTFCHFLPIRRGESRPALGSVESRPVLSSSAARAASLPAWALPFSAAAVVYGWPVTQSASFGSREKRIAYNEAHCRDLNERKAARTEDGSLGAGYRCECGHAECFERIRLTDGDWQQARAKPTRFAVAPNHVAVGVETVVKEMPHFWLVEKDGRAGEVAEKLD
jgi:hypothetical protein